ncbi:hypothetical protein F2P81_023522 [Scophthalmus maximus]|uniref:Ig-like domain-containing protein n=1 Tax=Scophthalmus maximus TaxID=52904 RepID=A0A6A4RZD7_SCOMX|nr:hypothetical protein F2P81_023522 [Scophthalmus maximus]
MPKRNKISHTVRSETKVTQERRGSLKEITGNQKRKALPVTSEQTALATSQVLKTDSKFQDLDNRTTRICTSLYDYAVKTDLDSSLKSSLPLHPITSTMFFSFFRYEYNVSRVHHGIEGKPLLLSVETRFPLDNAEIQGTWSHTRPSGTRTTLVTFTKDSTITDMMYRNHLLFKEPNASLLIQKLDPGDEGDYHLSLNIEFHNKTGRVIKEERTVHVTVDVPVSSPVIEKNPNYAVVEDKANVTWTCSVERGTRVVFQWLRDNIPLSPSGRCHFSRDNSTLLISPVRKEDKGIYHCVASNPVSHGRHSRGLELNVYYGPYNLEVNSGQGLRTGEVFTINPGELAFFECQADSNPPNSYVWISKSRNSTQVITKGPRLEVKSYRLAQAEEYLCRAFNNVTQKQDEAQFTLVVASLGTGKEKHTQEGSAVSPLAAITVCSLFIIGCMLLFFLRRTCHPKRDRCQSRKDLIVQVMRMQQKTLASMSLSPYLGNLSLHSRMSSDHDTATTRLPPFKEKHVFVSSHTRVGGGVESSPSHEHGNRAQQCKLGGPEEPPGEHGRPQSGGEPQDPQQGLELGVILTMNSNYKLMDDNDDDMI